MATILVRPNICCGNFNVSEPEADGEISSNSSQVYWNDGLCQGMYLLKGGQNPLKCSFLVILLLQSLVS